MTFSRFPWVIAQPGGQKRWHDLGDSMVNTRRISLAQRDFFGATNSWGMWFFFGIWYGDVSIPINTIFWGDEHPFTSYFDVHQGYKGFDTLTYQFLRHLIFENPLWVRGSQPTPLLNKRLRGPEIAKRLIHAEPWWKTRFWGDLRFHDIPWIPMAHDIPFCPTISYILYIHIIYIYFIYIYITYIYIHIYIYVSHYYIPHVIPSFEDPLVRRLTVECIQLMGAERMGNMLRKS